MEPHAAELPPPPRPSVPAPPEARPVPAYQWENLSGIALEMWPLIVAESQETFPEHDARPPAIDWEEYIRAQINGALQIVTARVNGALAGYIVWIVMRNGHRRREILARADTYYVAKEFRKGYDIARQMFAESEKRLKEQGVRTKVIQRNDYFSGLHEGVDRLFRMMGYEPYAVLYKKE